MQQFAVEIVDHVKSPESTTGIERIAHKVGEPYLVGVAAAQVTVAEHVLAVASWPGVSDSGSVCNKPGNPLMVPVMPSAKTFTTFPEAPARMPVEQRVVGINNINIAILHNRVSIVGRPRQTDTATTTLYGHVVLGNQTSDSFTLVRRP